MKQRIHHSQLDGLQRWELYEEIMETLSDAASNDLIIQGTSHPREDTFGAACVVYWMLNGLMGTPKLWYVALTFINGYEVTRDDIEQQSGFTGFELVELSQAFESGTGSDPLKDGCKLFHNKLMEILNLDTVSPLIDIKFQP